MNEVSQNLEISEGKIKISYSNYGKQGRNYGDLFDFLGDFDIVTASELNQDAIVMSGDVFLFTREDEFRLKKQSEICLTKVSSLYNFIDKNDKVHMSFMEWYGYLAKSK